MKRSKFFLLIVVAMACTMLLSQCNKNDGYPCKMNVTCYYSSNGIDPDSTASFTIITFDTSKYHNGDIDTLISRFNVPDIDRWSDDSLYNWCQNGHILYKKRRIGNTETVLPYKYYGVADSKGVLKYELPYPALLIVNAIKVDALKDSLDNITGYVRHTGTIQVELKENETVSKPIYMLRTN